MQFTLAGLGILLVAVAIAAAVMSRRDERHGRDDAPIPVAADLDFGETHTAIPFSGLPPVTDNAALTINVVRAGVNYRF